MQSVRCAECDASLERRAKYCSAACRQRAYRQRVAVAKPEPPSRPVLSSLFGRTRDLEAVGLLLMRHRLVTVVGAPGVGKSRAALALVERRQHVVVVDLANADSWREVVEQTVRSLESMPALLVLDGCERVRTECAALAEDLLARCPRLKLLVTSRECLGVEGEETYLLGPLDVGAAAELFVDRAHALNSQVRLDRNAAALNELCDRLDRLPLALELAARLVGVLSVPKIVAGLDDRFALLCRGPRDVPARHRSMYAAIDWSYRLLCPEEQAALRALSTRPDGIAADALVRSLARKSLVVPIPGTNRCRMLESVRAFAARQLADLGEEAVVVEHRSAPVDGAHPANRPGKVEERLLAVARLVGAGLTNQQIATRLGVSLRTVEGRVSALKSRLGLRSRAQIAAWERHGAGSADTDPPPRRDTR